MSPFLEMRQLLACFLFICPQILNLLRQKWSMKRAFDKWKNCLFVKRWTVFWKELDCRKPKRNKHRWHGYPPGYGESWEEKVTRRNENVSETQVYILLTLWVAFNKTVLKMSAFVISCDYEECKGIAYSLFKFIAMAMFYLSKMLNVEKTIFWEILCKLLYSSFSDVWSLGFGWFVFVYNKVHIDIKYKSKFRIKSQDFKMMWRKVCFRSYRSVWLGLMNYRMVLVESYPTDYKPKSH